MTFGGAELAVASLITSAIGTGVSAFGAVQAGKAAQAEANYKAGILNNNAIIANRKADDAHRRGEIEIAQSGVKSRLSIGQQRASIAGQNAQVDVQSGAELVADTAALGRLDQLTIQSNAEREALGFEAQASNFQAEAVGQQFAGSNARKSSFLKAGATLATGAATVATKWHGFKTDGALGSGKSTFS